MHAGVIRFMCLFSRFTICRVSMVAKFIVSMGPSGSRSQMIAYMGFLNDVFKLEPP